MAEIQSDGGPAFPFTYRDADSEYSGQPETHIGMSLRDWFAGQALPGIISTAPAGARAAWVTEAYCVADEMLLERGRKRK